MDETKLHFHFENIIQISLDNFIKDPIILRELARVLQKLWNWWARRYFAHIKINKTYTLHHYERTYPSNFS